MNLEKKRLFFDPLYKAVILEDPVRFNPWEPLSEPEKLVTPLIDTFEFVRLMRLRQAGLLYLVFPSATHTRFAHSLGCCHLGLTAMLSIEILDPDSGTDKPENLGKWLGRRQWQNGFLIALLCHDIGHFAFSHLIESNDSIENILGFQLNHEDVGCELIWGRGIVFEAMSLLTKGLHDPIRLNNLLRESRGDINFNLVCYLISGNESYLLELDERQKRQARILHALTSGLLDLDRIDHYRRDSEFMGLEIGFNYQALLHGLTVIGKSDGSAINLRIEDSALGHALSLLHLRERLTVDCFYADRCLSLGAMCNWALAKFMEIEKDRGVEQKILLSYLFRGDDELLHLLVDSSNQGVSSMASRLAANQPFTQIGCYKLKQTKNLKQIDHLIENINAAYNDKPMVLYNAHTSIKKWPSHDEWMALDHLLDENDNQLGESGPYANQIRHFKSVASTQNRNVWFFAADSSKISAIRALIQRADLWEGVSVEFSDT